MVAIESRLSKLTAENDWNRAQTDTEGDQHRWWFKCSEEVSTEGARLLINLHESHEGEVDIIRVPLHELLDHLDCVLKHKAGVIITAWVV